MGGARLIYTSFQIEDIHIADYHLYSLSCTSLLHSVNINRDDFQYMGKGFLKFMKRSHQRRAVLSDCLLEHMLKDVPHKIHK